MRVFIWSLALSFGVAWLSGKPGILHDWAGYAAGALVLVRVAWGFLGPAMRGSRSSCVRRRVFDYLKSIAAGSEARFIGHNPAGGAMIVALMPRLAATAATGWMMTTDAFWGVNRAQKLHSALAHGLLLLVLAHLGASRLRACGIAKTCLARCSRATSAPRTWRRRLTALGPFSSRSSRISRRKRDPEARMVVRGRAVKSVQFGDRRDEAEAEPLPGELRAASARSKR